MLKLREIGTLCAFSIPFVGGILELMPQALFVGEFQTGILEYFIRHSDTLRHSFLISERVYPGYGAKFIICQMILFFWFLISCSLSWAILWFTEPPPPEAEAGESFHRIAFILLFSSVLLIALVAVQIGLAYEPFTINDSRIANTPLIFRGFLWALINGLANGMLVMIQRATLSATK